MRYHGKTCSRKLDFPIYIKAMLLNMIIYDDILYRRIKGALAWCGKLTWESVHAWILKLLCYLIVWGMIFTFMVRLSFYAIPLLIYDVILDITIIPKGTQL